MFLQASAGKVVGLRRFNPKTPKPGKRAQRRGPAEGGRGEVNLPALEGSKHSDRGSTDSSSESGFRFRGLELALMDGFEQSGLDLKPQGRIQVVRIGFRFPGLHVTILQGWAPQFRGWAPRFEAWAPRFEGWVSRVEGQNCEA